MNNGDYWYLLDHGPKPGPFNMAVDEFLLSHDLPPVLRLYQWEPATLSLGFSQQVERHVDIESVKANRVPVVRRLTGGKAVLHDSELTYSVTGPMTRAPFDQDLLGSYQQIAQAFIGAFRKLTIPATMASRDKRAARGGVTSCFASPSAFEIVVDDRKLLGSAQKRTRNRVLQHGSLLLDYNATDWSALMKRNAGISTDRVTDMRTILGQELNLDSIKQAIVSGFAEYFQVRMEHLVLNGDNLAEINEIARRNYSNLIAQLDSEQA